MNPNDNPWIDPNVSKYFNECIERERREREFSSNAIANEIESLREQQEYQFYQNQLTNNAEEYVRSKKLYRHSQPDPETLRVIEETMSTIEKYDMMVSNSDLNVVFFLMGCVFVVGGLTMMVVLRIFGVL